MPFPVAYPALPASIACWIFDMKADGVSWPVMNNPAFVLPTVVAAAGNAASNHSAGWVASLTRVRTRFVR